MKKVSAKAASNRNSGIHPSGFEDELNESRQPQKRLQEIVTELEETIGFLRQNLRIAHRSARPLRDKREGSASKVNPGKATGD
jgi:hypothetical protein